jgi:hypothetical protein
LEIRLDHHSSPTNSILDELTGCVIVNRSEFGPNVSKLDENVDRLDREIRQVKDALNENYDKMKRQQKENVERINQK